MRSFLTGMNTDANCIANVLQAEPPTSAATDVEVIDPTIKDVTNADNCDLDEEALKLLGEDPTKPKVPSAVIRPELLVRWSNWNLKGLESEVKKSLFEKYKCDKALEPQKLNPELIHFLSESAIKRDSYFINTQNLLGAALTGLGLAVSALHTNKALDRPFLLSTLYDVGKILTDLHNSQLLGRKSCIIPNILNKNFKSILENSNPDEFIFGLNLSDKLKEAKVLEKMGNELKNPATSSTVRRPGLRPLNFIRPTARKLPNAVRQSGFTNKSSLPKRTVTQRDPFEINGNVRSKQIGWTFEKLLCQVEIYHE